MPSFGSTGQDNEIVNSSYVGGNQTVGTSQVEAKVGASKLSGRQILQIHNRSNNTIYYGPSGVTTSNGTPLFKDQMVAIPVGDQVAVYMIAASAGNTITIQEWA